MAGAAVMHGSLLFLLLLLLAVPAAIARPAASTTAAKKTGLLKSDSKSYVAIVATSSDTLSLILAKFTAADEDQPSVEIAARTFYVGTIGGVAVVIVNAGSTSVNVASAAQALVDNFTVKIFISVGTGGSTDDERLAVGDVVIPNQIAYTGNWLWQANGTSDGELVFGEFNVDGGDDNSLGSIKYLNISYYTPSDVASVFYIPVSSEYLALASSLEIELESCLNSTNCLSKNAAIKLDYILASASHYMENDAYRLFLRNKFDVSAVDTASSSSAVGLVATSNGVDFISIRGMTNYAGGTGRNSDLYELGRNNVVMTVISFIELVGSASGVIAK